MAQGFASFGLCVWFLVGVFGVEMDEIKSVSVMEGDSVTLNTDVSEIQRDDLILWRFGAEDLRLADINRTNKMIFTPERLSERLKLDQTGSLTITNISLMDSGVYKAQIIGNKVARKTFNVTVYAHLPIPDLTTYCPPTSSSSSKCVVLCSVCNVSDVSLSWYKGMSLLSSISVSDLNIRLSLHLEVEYQDTDTYTCVINNTITNTTQQLRITHVCHMCSDCVDSYPSSCDNLEAVIRLVVSALVGLAAIIACVILIYDIRCRRAEEKRTLADIQSETRHLSCFKHC